MLFRKGQPCHILLSFLGRPDADADAEADGDADGDDDASVVRIFDAAVAQRPALKKKSQRSTFLGSNVVGGEMVTQGLTQNAINGTDDDDDDVGGVRIS